MKNLHLAQRDANKNLLLAEYMRLYTELEGLGQKGDYNALLPDGSVNRGLEGRFHVKVMLQDYAGNSNTYDSQLCYNFVTGQVSNSYPCNTLPTEQRDLTGKIDNTPPLTMLNPFQNSWSEGGKTAHDTQLTPDSVYINNIYSGYVTRNKTINIKAQVEANQRAMLIVDGVVQKNSSTDANGLIKASDINCKTPDVGTASTEANVSMPLTDKTAPDGLITQYSKLCDISYSYTFGTDGKGTLTDSSTNTNDMSQATDLHTFQIITVDNAGQTSASSTPLKVYHDTQAPKPADIELDGNNDIHLHGEGRADYSVNIKSPAGRTISTFSGWLDEDGDSIDAIHGDFNAGDGTYTIEATTYDSAGNQSTSAKTYTQVANPIGGGGGSSAGDTPQLSDINLDVKLFGNSNILVTRADIPAPININASLTPDSTKYTVTGTSHALGDNAKVKLTYDQTYFNSKAINDCSRLGSWGLVYRKCINTRLSTLNYNAVAYKNAKVTYARVKVAKATDNTQIAIVQNTKNFTSQEIAYTPGNQIKVNSIISVAVPIGNNITTDTAPTDGTYSNNFEPIAATLEQLGTMAPRGLPVASYEDKDIGQGPGGSFSHIDVNGHDISAIDISKSGTVEILATMDGVAQLRRNMPSTDKSGTCSNTYSYSKVWGCYVTVTNSKTGYLTINAHLNYTEAITQYGDFGTTKDVSNRNKIGIMCNTGYSTSQHAHYEFRRGPLGTKEFYDGIPYIADGKDAQRIEMAKLTGLTIQQLSR